MANLIAPKVKQQAVSVTRKMAASLPGLREIAQSRGLKVHHLGAGYPHPEVTDPRGFLQHQSDYFDHIKDQEGLNDPNVLPEYLRESYSYTDTLGPKSARETFAHVYGKDWNLNIDPENSYQRLGPLAASAWRVRCLSAAANPLPTSPTRPLTQALPLAPACVSTPPYSVSKWTARAHFQAHARANTSGSRPRLLCTFLLHRTRRS